MVFSTAKFSFVERLFYCLKDIVIFQEILKNGQKEGVTLPKFLENLRDFFREVDEALINF